MIAVSPPTPFTPAQLRERVQQILTAGALPSILQAGHPVLRMHEAPGVGLAAPQIGIPLQLAVLEDRFDVDPESAAMRHRAPLDFLAVLNPRYAPLGTETAAFFEGCLSLSGLQAVVVRHARVLLQFETPDGRGTEQEYEGWQARIVQHETDHLQGTLYVDRAELRSLSSNAEYAANWVEPGIGKARAGLGFLPGNP